MKRTIEELREMDRDNRNNALVQAQNEADRLRAINAELLAALKVGVAVQKSDLVGIEWKRAVREWLVSAGAAIAKAEANE